MSAEVDESFAKYARWIRDAEWRSRAAGPAGRAVWPVPPC
jgi:hypothetical protein